VRVVLDLTERADYRLLSTDDGARYYIQLLPPVSLLATAGELRQGRVIMVDPGHGGSDPGAEGVLAGVWEAPVNLEISFYLVDALKDMGYGVLLTRDRDRFVSLGARADYANQVLPYLFVSVHTNSLDDPDYQGIMTFHHPASQRGPRLAALIQEELLKATGAVDKRVRPRHRPLRDGTVAARAEGLPGSCYSEGTMKVRDAIKALERDGWYHVRTKGSLRDPR